MLSVMSWAIGGLLTAFLGFEPAKLEVVSPVSWQEARIFAVPTDPDPAVESMVNDYLQRLAALGFPREQQGVWIQSEWAYLAQNQEKIPLSAASLTKVATSLATLEKLGADYRFTTQIYSTGTVAKGILQGDLIIQGGGDPLFVWEEAIALGNALQQLGIREVKGNLLITGNFAMNFQSNPKVTGNLLKVALNERLWSSEVQKIAQSLPPNTPHPKIAIAGTVQVEDTLPENAQLLIRHQSLTVAQLLKQMNLYSNNDMAEMFAKYIGGAAIVAQMAAQAAQVSPAEIQLENGSGLSVNNRISPRAVSGMFMALDERLKSSPLKLTDLFPLSGRDKKGTLKWRKIPSGVAIKTGTLAQVSALAGVIPTQERGLVWFAIINHGGNIERFRNEQDLLLQQLSQHWHIIPVSNIIPSPTETIHLGDPNRNIR